MADFGGRYRRVKLLGSGGMGDVWLAVDEELGDRQVAIKIMRPELLADAEGLAWFQREMLLACRMQHPNIMTVFSSGTENGVPFMVMEYLKGHDLTKVPANWGADEIARVGREACLALAYAHGLGVVHRDVKPGNLFLCNTGLLKVTDFGLAKALTTSKLTQPGTRAGTIPYMAPEQLLGKPATFAIDVWAIGCTLYEFLSGRRPRDYATLEEYLAAAARGDRVAPLATASNVPSWLAGAVMAMLAPDPARRPTADECAQLLSGPQSHPIPLPVPLPQPGPSRWPPPPQPVPPPVRPRTRTANQGSQPTIAVAPSWLNARSSLLTAAAIGAVAAISVLIVFLSGGAGKGSLVAALGSPGDGNDEVQDVAFGPKAQTLAVGTTNVNSAGYSSGGSTFLWDTVAKKRLANLTPPENGGANVVAFGPRGTILAIADGTNTYLWNTATKKRTTTLSDQGGDATALAWGPSGTMLAVGGMYGTDLWDVTTGSYLTFYTDPQTNGVTSVAFAADGTTMAVGDGNGSTYLWDLHTGNVIGTLTDPGTEGVTSVAFEPGRTTMAVGDGNGRTYLWNIVTQKITATLTNPGSRGVSALAWGPDGTTLAAGSAIGDGTASTYLWSVPGMEIVGTLTDPASRGVSSLAFAPSGTTLAVGDYNGSTYLWHVLG